MEIKQKFRLTKKERDNLESYFQDAGFIMGSPDFEAEVARLRQHPDKIRDILRMNVQMKVEIEKLSEEFAKFKRNKTEQPRNNNKKAFLK